MKTIRPEIDCIYIPFIRREMDDLRFLSLCWRVMPPFDPTDSAATALMLSIDQKLEKSEADKICTWFDGLGFSQVNCIETGLSDEDAVYIKGSAQPECTLEFGMKSGPNRHFIHNQSILSGKFRHTLQCEVDLIPVTRYWYSKLRSSLPRNYLVSGPIYRGPSRLPAHILQHINGNAFYNTSHHMHSLWLNALTGFLKEQVALGKTHIAFDVVTCALITFYGTKPSIKALEEGRFGITQQDQIRELVSALHFNEQILNAGAHLETRPDYPLNFAEHIRLFAPEAKLVHGRKFRFHGLIRILARLDKLKAGDKDFLQGYVRIQINQLGVGDFHEAILRKNPELRNALGKSFINQISNPQFAQE